MLLIIGLIMMVFWLAFCFANVLSHERKKAGKSPRNFGLLFIVCAIFIGWPAVALYFIYV